MKKTTQIRHDPLGDKKKQEKPTYVCIFPEAFHEKTVQAIFYCVGLLALIIMFASSVGGVYMVAEPFHGWTDDDLYAYGSIELRHILLNKGVVLKQRFKVNASNDGVSFHQELSCCRICLGSRDSLLCWPSGFYLLCSRHRLVAHGSGTLPRVGLAMIYIHASPAE